ncbi:MAG: AMP-binding protein, partial [Acidobacteriota bacterium]
RFWRRLGYQVIQGYGLTEAAPLVTLNHPLHAETGSVGRPLPGVELQLSDSGEILVRGPSVATPAADGARVDAAGWLHTGDLGRRTEEGRIEFVGRRRERIVTPAGLNVDLETVATELRRQPAIIDAVTLERPWGPAGSVSAVLLVRPGADVPSAIRAANVSLPDAARVRDWYVWPETDLPRTPTGKPRRAPLVVWLQQTRNHRTLHHKVAGDPVPALQTVTRLVSEISATSHRELTPGTPLGEALTSLERVELAARLEQDFGIFLSDEAFAGRQTLAGLAKGIARPQQAEQGGAPLLEIPATRGASTPIEAPWRLWAPVRGIRFLLQELAMQPLWRSCVRLRVSGLEHVRSLPPPFLIAANHVSLLDPGAVLFAFPWRLRRRIAPAALWERFSVHRRGRLQYLLGVLALNIFPLVQLGDWRSSLQIAGFLADRGYCPLIYPEGGRSSDGMPRGFRQGIGLISQDLHLPILPCAVAGLHTVLPVGSRWPRRSGLRRLPVAVQFGEPLAAASPGNDREALVKTLTRRINELHRA